MCADACACVDVIRRGPCADAARFRPGDRASSRRRRLLPSAVARPVGGAADVPTARGLRRLHGRRARATRRASEAKRERSGERSEARSVSWGERSEAGAERGTQ